MNGTERAQHLRNADLVEHLTDHTFLLCEPVASIANVQVDGFPAPVGSYSVDAAADPARVVFNTQPYYERYSAGSKFLEMQFDAVGASNTATNPAYAFDIDELATAAVVAVGSPKLAIVQQTVNPDLGQILKAYISVAHWEEGTINADYVQVAVTGAGVVGILSAPNPADQITLDGDVNLDHAHLHATGGAHAHSFDDPTVYTVLNDPAFSSSSDPHGHDVSIKATPIDSPIGNFPLGTWITVEEGYTKTYNLTLATYPNEAIYVEYTQTWKTALKSPPIVELHITVAGVAKVITLTGSNPDTVLYIGAGTVTGTPYITYQTQQGDQDSYGSEWILYKCNIIFHALNSVGDNSVAVNTSKTASGSAITGIGTSGNVVGQGADVNDEPIKAYDDVQDLVTDNAPLNLNSQDNPSHTIVDLFDITELVNFDWNWFTGKEIILTYVSTGENKNVYVLHAFFGVEFAPREVVFSNEVSAEVVASRTTPAECIDYLLTAKASMASALLDAVSFGATAASHQARNYTLDGLLPGDMTVRDGVKKICRQTHSRCFSNAGLIRLVEKTVAPPVVKALVGGNGDLQLRSISVSKQPLTEISNRIDLFYNYDQLGNSHYMATVRAENADSIGHYGLRYQPDNYRFDLIRSAEMAESVAAYYLAVDGQPATWYSFSAYLPQLALEPEDGIQLTANFHGLTETPLVIRGIERRFGSGKNELINLITITAEKHNYDEAELFSLYASFAPEVLPGDLGDAVTGLADLANIELDIL